MLEITAARRNRANHFRLETATAGQNFTFARNDVDLSLYKSATVFFEAAVSIDTPIARYIHNGQNPSATVGIPIHDQELRLFDINELRDGIIFPIVDFTIQIQLENEPQHFLKTTYNTGGAAATPVTPTSQREFDSVFLTQNSTGVTFQRLTVLNEEDGTSSTQWRDLEGNMPPVIPSGPFTLATQNKNLAIAVKTFEGTGNNATYPAGALFDRMLLIDTAVTPPVVRSVIWQNHISGSAITNAPAAGDVEEATGQVDELLRTLNFAIGEPDDQPSDPAILQATPTLPQSFIALTKGILLNQTQFDTVATRTTHVAIQNNAAAGIVLGRAYLHDVWSRTNATLTVIRDRWIDLETKATLTPVQVAALNIAADLDSGEQAQPTQIILQSKDWIYFPTAADPVSGLSRGDIVRELVDQSNTTLPPIWIDPDTDTPLAVAPNRNTLVDAAAGLPAPIPVRFTFNAATIPNLGYWFPSPNGIGGQLFADIGLTIPLTIGTIGTEVALNSIQPFEELRLDQTRIALGNPADLPADLNLLNTTPDTEVSLIALSKSLLLNQTSFDTVATRTTHVAIQNNAAAGIVLGRAYLHDVWSRTDPALTVIRDRWIDLELLTELTPAQVTALNIAADLDSGEQATAVPLVLKTQDWMVLNPSTFGPRGTIIRELIDQSSTAIPPVWVNPDTDAAFATAPNRADLIDPSIGIPTAIPVVYRLNNSLTTERRGYWFNTPNASAGGFLFSDIELTTQVTIGNGATQTLASSILPYLSTTNDRVGNTDDAPADLATLTTTPTFPYSVNALLKRILLNQATFDTIATRTTHYAIQNNAAAGIVSGRVYLHDVWNRADAPFAVVRDRWIDLELLTELTPAQVTALNIAADLDSGEQAPTTPITLQSKDWRVITATTFGPVGTVLRELVDQSATTLPPVWVNPDTDVAFATAPSRATLIPAELAIPAPVAVQYTLNNAPDVIVRGYWYNYPHQAGGALFSDFALTTPVVIGANPTDALATSILPYDETYLDRLDEPTAQLPETLATSFNVLISDTTVIGLPDLPADAVKGELVVETVTGTKNTILINARFRYNGTVTVANPTESVGSPIVHLMTIYFDNRSQLELFRIRKTSAVTSIRIHGRYERLA